MEPEAPPALPEQAFRRLDDDLLALLHNLGGEVRDEGVPAELAAILRRLRGGE